MRKFKAIYYFQRWECGDGCCSDYWHDLEIYEDGKLIIEKKEIRGIYDSEDATKYARKFIENILDDEEFEVEVDFDE